MISTILLIFTSANVIIDETVLRRIAPGVQIQYDTIQKHENKDTVKQIQPNVEDTTVYEYEIELRIQSRDGNGKLEVQIPKLNTGFIDRIPDINYALGSDTSKTIAIYRGRVNSGRPVQQSRGATSYAKTTVTNLGVTSEKWESYSTGMTITLQITEKKNRNICQLSYTYAIPVGTSNPPSTQTATYSTEADIDTDKQIRFSGIDYYGYKRSWWLLGFGRTIEKMTMEINVKIHKPMMRAAYSP